MGACNIMLLPLTKSNTHHCHQRHEYPAVHRDTLQMYSPEAGDQWRIL